MRAGRVLLVGEEHSRGALAAARSLGRAGWDVGVAVPRSRGLLPASRFVRRRHLVTPPGIDPTGWADALAADLSGITYDVAFGTGDDWVLALAAAADRLPCGVPHGPHDALLRTFDKLELSAAAAAAGLLPPRTEALNEAALSTWAGPVVVKQRLHVAPAAGSASRIETVLFGDANAASGWCRQLLAESRPAVLQEVVAGELVALCVLTDPDGTLVAASQQVATQVWPEPAGVSARAVTCRVEPDLVDRALELLRRLGLTGLAQLQLLRDDAGELHCIDVNPRFYGSLALAVAAGADLPRLWADLACGRAVPAPPVLARPGVRYQWLEGDLRRAVRQRSGLAGVMATAPRSVHATITADDPAPAAAQSWALISRAARKLRKTAAGAGS